MVGICSKCLRRKGDFCTEGVPADLMDRCEIPNFDAKRLRNAAMDKAAEWISDFPFLPIDQRELQSMIEKLSYGSGGISEALRNVRSMFSLACLCPSCGEEIEIEDGNKGDCPFCEGYLGEAEIKVIVGQ